MKIFFIGFNKTGTTTYHKSFGKLIRSKHSTDWPKKSHSLDDDEFINFFSKWDCYSDGELCNFKRLNLYFKNSLFILNTRNLYDWIYSRIKHIYRDFPKKATGEMATEWHKYDDKFNIIKLWILRRNNYYKEVLNYFKNKNNFIMIDIYSKNLKYELSNFTGLNIKTIVKSNIRNKELDLVKKFKKDIIKAFELLGIKKEDYNTIEFINYIN